MQRIQIKNINKGGIADSDYLGGAESVADMVGLDIHSEAGIIKVNQALTKESGTTIDDFVKCGIPCSNGNTYLFGSTNGKIWKRTSGGVYSLETTVSPSVGSVGILDAREYQGYIYYATQNRLGRIPITPTMNWTSTVVTISIANPAVVTWTAHGLSNGAGIKFSTTGALPTGIIAGTVYYVRKLTEDTFHLYDTYLRAIGTGTTGRIVTSGSQSGVHSAVTRIDDFGIFINGDTEWHPMWELNLVLYIGDKDVVAQVDAGLFSADALDLPFPAETRIKCLGEIGTDLLIGTYINSNIVQTRIYRWNTWSVSFTSSDWIPEVGINSFLATDNFVIVNAGTKGNLYLYDGTNLDPYKQIKGNWAGTTNKAQVHPNARLNFNGLPLFGVSNISGNPCTLGVYSLGRANRNYPYVLNCEQGLSNTHLSNVEIGAIIGVGDIYLVTWKDTTSGTVYGVDKLDLSLKYPSAYLTTRIIMVDRMTLINYKTIDVAYRSLPVNTGFTLSAKVNHGTMTPISSGEVSDDTIRKIVSSEVDINDATTVQVKVAFTSSLNTAPEVELIEIAVD